MPSVYAHGDPPVLDDWLPWNHTFDGNNNVHTAQFIGGSFYIDEGKPTTALIHKTIANLREIAPTAHCPLHSLTAAELKTLHCLLKKVHQ